MSWKDNLRTCQFKGARFQGKVSEITGGRRGELSEYPLRDDASWEDLGRKAREYALTGFVIGENYMVERNILLKALESRGIGQLIHPFLGSVDVVSSKYSVRETVDDGGMAVFQLTFLEVLGPSSTIEADDKSALVNKAAADLDVASIAGFAEKFDRIGVPAFVVDSSFALLADVDTYLLSQATNAEFFDEIEDIASFRGLASEALAERVSGIIGGVPKSVADPGSALDKLLLTSSGSVLASVPRETSNRLKEVINADAAAGLVRRLALSASARHLTQSTFDSVGAAREALEKFQSSADFELTSESIDDEEYEAVQGLFSRISTDLSSRLGGLPAIKTIHRDGLAPSIVLAYDLYGDATRDDEIIKRNGYSRPGFAPAHDGIEVLSS